MKTLQFEAVKVALKQNKDGYILTLCLHPDEIPDELVRDYVGARYQVVMVRLGSHEEPMDRQEEFSGSRALRIAGLLSRDKDFWRWLHQRDLIFLPDEEEATEWLRGAIGVQSRSDLKTNHEARIKLDTIHKEFKAWKNAD